MFNPSRLTLARQRRGWTKQHLAKELGVTSKAISKYEAQDDYSPSAENMEKLASVLNFPKEFFFGEDLESITPETASFRSLRSVRAYQRDMALSAGSLAILLSEWIDNQFSLPEPNIPLFEPGIDPESAAIAVRLEWGLGDKGIRNIIHLLEAHGVRVFSLAVDASEVDAFSMWSNNKPFVFLNTGKSTERTRFDAAHELGHLILHRNTNHTKANQEMEKEADRFASAFLMPETSILARTPKAVTIQKLVELKKVWGVSVAALNYRLHSLGLTSEWVSRSIFVELSKMGYRTEEPEPMKPEQSQVLAKVFAALKEEGITRPVVARQLNISIDDLDALIFGLAITKVNTNRETVSSRPTPPKEFKLHLVK